MTVCAQGAAGATGAKSYVYSKDREIPIWFWASSRRLYTCTSPHECYFEGRGPCCYVRTASVPSSGVLCAQGAAAPQERRATYTLKIGRYRYGFGLRVDGSIRVPARTSVTSKVEGHAVMYELRLYLRAAYYALKGPRRHRSEELRILVSSATDCLHGNGVKVRAERAAVAR